MSDKIVKLKDGGGYLYPISVLNGIDTSNVLANQYGVYTATQDCYVIFRGSRDRIHDVYLNDQVVVQWSSSGGLFQICCPLKKGDTFGYSDYSGAKYTIYGIRNS